MGINNGRMEFSGPLPSLPLPVCLRQETPEGNTDARAAPSLCIAALDAFAATAGGKKRKKQTNLQFHLAPMALECREKRAENSNFFG